MTPDEESVNETSADSLDNTGRHSYEASGLEAGEEYNVALVTADSVSVDEDGIVTFDGFDQVPENDDTSIELVNGASTGAPAGGGNESTQETVEAQADGTITFTIDSTVPREVVPVVYDDADESDTLDLEDNGEPTEDFGIGGQKSWVPDEAAQGAFNGNVESTNFDFDYFVLGGETYYYDEGDDFRLNGVTISLVDFEGLLTGSDVGTVGDELNGTSTYEPDEEDTSIFDVVTDEVPDPTDVAAEVVPGEEEGDWNVELSWTASAQGDVTYEIERDTGNDGAWDTELADGVEETSLTDEDLAADDYNYRVRAVGATSGSPSAWVESGAVTVPPPDEELSVLANGTIVETDASDDGEATEDDVWAMHFDNDVVLDGASLDVGGEIVEDGVNADFVAEDDVLTVTLTDDVAVTYPETIVAHVGIESVDGVAADFSADNTLDLEGPAPLGYDDGDTIGIDGEDEFELTFNRELIQVSAENTDNYTWTDAANSGATEVTDASLGADGRTVTFTLDDAAAATDTFDVDSGLLDTEGRSAVTPMQLTVN